MQTVLWKQVVQVNSCSIDSIMRNDYVLHCSDNYNLTSTKPFGYEARENICRGIPS